MAKVDKWYYYPKGHESAGYLNVPEIYKRHPDATLFVFVGSRQIGKTYGATDLLRNLGEPFIYLRLTEDEREQSLSSKSNLFIEKGFEWAQKMRIDDGKICYVYDDDFGDGKQPLIMASSLQKLNHMRGYAGGRYKHMFLDEFIPMKEAYKRKGQGKVLADAYMTINGTREIDNATGTVDRSKAVKLWLLANANDLNGDILTYFDLVLPLIKMQRRKQEYCYLPERGVVLFNLCDSPISESMQRTALFGMMGNNTEYARTAIANEFSGDDMIGIKSVPLRECKPLFTFNGFNVYKHKFGNYVYIASGGTPLKTYFDTRNSTHLKAMLDYWVKFCPIIPVDGDNCFYSDYSAKVALYGVLKLDKVR